MKKIMILSALISLTACSSGKNENPPTQVGMANPASVYCAKIGGKLDIVNTNDGQVGYCTLPSGERIEEWSLYRRDHKNIRALRGFFYALTPCLYDFHLPSRK